MELLTNAVKSIQLGIEDFENGDDKRIVSSVRNLYAGILLLFKEKLVRMSPKDTNEVLLKAKTVPKKQKDGSVVFVGVGKNTVNLKQIQERFKNLNINVDWNRVARVAEIRNALEHYYSPENKATIREALSKTFLIVRDFIIHQLNEDPLDLLGNKCWSKLLNISEVFEKEKKECDEALSSIDWESEALRAAISEVSCSECGSSLVTTEAKQNKYLDEIKFSCRACGNIMDFSNVASNCLENYFSFETYLVFDDGADPVLVDCPECCNSGYVIEEDRCAICGYEREYEDCVRCGNSLTIDEQHLGGFCSYCNHIMLKDD